MAASKIALPWDPAASRSSTYLYSLIIAFPNSVQDPGATVSFDIISKDTKSMNPEIACIVKMKNLDLAKPPHRGC